MGDSKGPTVLEHLAQIDTYAKVSNWADDEKALFVMAKLQGIALQFVKGREVLHEITGRYPRKNESVEEFADRYRKLCH